MAASKSNFFADSLDNIGTFFNLPDFGWSEGLAGNNKTANSGRAGVRYSTLPIANQAGQLSAETPDGAFSYGDQNVTLLPGANPAPTGDNITYDASGNPISAAQMAQNNALKGDVRAKAQQLLALYDELFGKVDETAKAQVADLEKQYAEQFKTAGDQYSKAIPTIESSYASIGAGDSTDNTYAKNDAKSGFEDTTKKIGKNKEDDLSKVGKTVAEKKATYQTGKDSINNNLSRLDSTTDTGALETIRNDVEKGMGDANIEKATVGTDSSFRDALRKSTGDNGRFAEVTNALDSVIKGSMSGAVKQAAVKSIVDNAGLDPAEKEKINLQYGQVFNEQNVA